MQSISFLPLHGCWLLHYDLCPSRFHMHSDRLFQIISALSLSFHIDSIFYWKERNGLPLPFSFLSTPVYSLTFPWTFHIHYHVRFFRNAGIKHLIIQKTTTAKCFAKKYLLLFCRINLETICYVQYFLPAEEGEFLLYYVKRPHLLAFLLILPINVVLSPFP